MATVPPQALVEFLDAVKQVTQSELARGSTLPDLLVYTMEELGEVARAVAYERGQKPNAEAPAETSRQEAIDLVLCALSLFYASGGTDAELVEYGGTKLRKWEKSLTNRS